MKNKKIVELMLILGVTAGLAGGCTQKTKEQSYVNITETAAENSTEQSQEYLYDENGNQFLQISNNGHGHPVEEDLGEFGLSCKVVFSTILTSSPEAV